MGPTIGCHVRLLQFCYHFHFLFSALTMADGSGFLEKNFCHSSNNSFWQKQYKLHVWFNVMEKKKKTLFVAWVTNSPFVIINKRSEHVKTSITSPQLSVLLLLLSTLVKRTIWLGYMGNVMRTWDVSSLGSKLNWLQEWQAFMSLPLLQLYNAAYLWAEIVFS